jgi:hypothetical protein
MKRLLAAALLLAAPAARAEGGDFKKLEKISGSAAIVNNDKALAHQQALDQALREAVGQVAGVTLDSATLTEGSTLVQDKIFAHANGYVKSYNTDVDKDQGDGTWLVQLSDLVVGTGDLSKDVMAVKSTIAAMAHPRLYTLIREQVLEDLKGNAKDKPSGVAQLSQGIVEEGLVSHLLPLGWKFVDPQVASGKVHVENALTTDLSGLNGRDFATTGADYVILGSVIVRPSDATERGTALANVGFVELRSVLYVKSTDTGDVVASVTKTETVNSVMSQQAAATKALTKAGEELSEALQKQVLETYRKRSMGTGDIHLMVAVADYDALQAFEGVLKDGVSNVKAVDEVSYTDGKADLSVKFAGSNSKQLAGSLSNKTVKGLTVKVTKVTANTVEVKLAR